MTRIPLQKIAAVLVVAFWLVMTALLLQRHYGGRTPQGPSVSGGIPEGVFGEHWFGVYQKDRRIGYSSWKFEREGSGYAASETLKLRLLVLDASREMELVTKASLGPDLGLDSFTLSLISDVSMDISGTVRGNSLGIVIDSAGTRTERSIRLKERPVLNLSMVPSVMKGGMTPGRRYDLNMLDPSSMSVEPVSFSVEGKEQVRSMGAMVDTVRLRGSFRGGDLSVWLTEQGEIIRQETPLGFTLIRETKEEALRTQQPAADMAEASSVPFRRVLPEGLSFLKVKISGIDAAGLDLDGGRQRLRGDVLEIRLEDLKRMPASSSGKISPDYLADSIFIQAGDSRIVAQAREIVGTEKDPLRAARLINSWVYRNMEKSPLLSVPLSTAVLQTGRGDCNEHAVLFASLARASGIPARIALGLVHDTGRFYYHAWNEIYLSGWVAVDPTLGQFPADAGHIRLIAGDLDRQARVVSLLGKVRLEEIGSRP